MTMDKPPSREDKILAFSLGVAAGVIAGLIFIFLIDCLTARGQVLPDPKLTPGATFSGATRADICESGWAHRHRHVTVETKREVYREYGDSYRDCHDRGSPEDCAVDHLIPLELGGSNDIKNLWPQPASPQPGYHEKDNLESDLHELVCSGVMSLQDAQRCIASNWYKCYQEHEQ